MADRMAFFRTLQKMANETRGFEKAVIASISLVGVVR
jgi:hypothetical protein